MPSGGKRPEAGRPRKPLSVRLDGYDSATFSFLPLFYAELPQSRERSIFRAILYSPPINPRESNQHRIVFTNLWNILTVS